MEANCLPSAEISMNTEDLRKYKVGDREHWCPFCQKTIKGDTCNLRDHLRIHTGHRPYKCPYCPYRATRSQHLKSHVVCKHPERCVANQGAAREGRQPITGLLGRGSSQWQGCSGGAVANNRAAREGQQPIRGLLGGAVANHRTAGSAAQPITRLMWRGETNKKASTENLCFWVVLTRRHQRIFYIVLGLSIQLPGTLRSASYFTRFCRFVKPLWAGVVEYAHRTLCVS